MKTAMILAAGRGSRLKPITDAIPKSLCEVHGKTLIEHHVIRLAKAGFTRLIVNHAYLGGHIRRHLGKGHQWGVQISYSPEPTGGLETGGGIVNALPLIGSEAFVCVNADIYTDYDFSQLQLPTESLAHLVLVKNNAALNHFGDFALSRKGILSNDHAEYTYSGIAVYRPEIFKKLPLVRYSVIPLLRKLTQQQRLTGEIYTGLWFDVGSHERLKAVNKFVF